MTSRKVVYENDRVSRKKVCDPVLHHVVYFEFNYSVFHILVVSTKLSLSLLHE